MIPDLDGNFYGQHQIFSSWELKSLIFNEKIETYLFLKQNQDVIIS